MQTIYIDISNKGVIPTIYAKQGDVSRKFRVIFTESGIKYQIPNNAVFSVWYSGASGEGNYTAIGDRSAFAINGSTVTVELITQMLTNAGSGDLSLVMSGADGSQLGTWNITYEVEHVPGMDSDAAEQYFTAFSEVIKNLPYPDVSLTAPGKAADAAAVGVALAEKNKLLWINDSPTSSFGELTVPLDMSDVSFVAVASIYGTIILQKGQMGVWGFHDPSNVYTRAVTVTEDGVQFGECIRNGAEAANEIMVPQSIWKFAGSIPTPGEGSVDDPSTNPYIQALARLQEDVEDLKQHGGGGASSEEWITIADITTTEEVNKIWQDAQGFRRIMMYMYLPSDLSVKSLYGFYTSDMWSSLYGFSFTGDGRKLLLDFEVIDDLGITLQLNINGNNSSVTNVNNGKLLREGTETELNGIGTALQNNGVFPVGTVIKIRGLKA